MKRKIKIQSISAWSIGIALILTVVFVVILHYEKNEVKRLKMRLISTSFVKMRPDSYRMGLII